MITTYYIIIALLALGCAVLLTLLLSQRRRHDEAVSNLQNTISAANEAIAKSQAEHSSQLHSLQQAIEQERFICQKEQLARAKVEAELDAERRSATEKARSQEEFEKTLREQFRNLATDVLSEQSRQFKEDNRESIDLILKPFKDNITDFRTRVETIFTEQTKESGSLKKELQILMSLNQQITTETTNLTNALRGNSKVQGDWGEMILETILDSSNLIQGIHYDTQYNIKDEEGKNLRPDVVLHLPNNKKIIIDSKVSLTAYVNYVSANDEAERKVAMAAHIVSVRQHVKELGTKSYQQLLQSPDFVIMFVPNEPAFLDALKEDNTIWSDAYDKKVIISSPTNLFALLKIVDDLWRREEQNKNHKKILDESVRLYEQLLAFTVDLEAVGTNIGKAKEAYDNAYKRLHTGNNNIVRVGERLRKLGLPTTKKQSDKLIELSEEGAEELSEDNVTPEVNQPKKLAANE